MHQTDLLDWLEDNKAIVSALPSSHTLQRQFIIEQLTPFLKPVLIELETLNASPMAISEALHHFAKTYSQQAQEMLLHDRDNTEH
jgi:hypothetical protein